MKFQRRSITAVTFTNLFRSHSFKETYTICKNQWTTETKSHVKFIKFLHSQSIPCNTTKKYARTITAESKTTQYVEYESLSSL